MIQKVGGLILVGVALAAAFGCGAFFALTAVFASGQQFESHVTIAIGSPHPAEPTAVATPDPTLTTWAEATAAPPVDVETVEPTAVPEQWDIAGLPTLDPCYFNMYTEECRHYIEVPGYDWTAVTAPWDAPPVDLYGADLTYCYDPSSVWTDEMWAVTAEAFAVWEPAGLTFRPVPYSSDWRECFILAQAYPDPAQGALGYASSTGPLWGGQNYVYQNTHHRPYDVRVVIHEIGHILGLEHSTTGIMQPLYDPSTWVAQADIDNVRSFWFRDK